MVERGADEHLKRYDYCIRIAKYLVVETFVCICSSALFQNLGPPPWCLKAGSWHETITRVSLWLNMCHGAATFANGDFTKDFQTPRLKILWLACLFLTCVGQGFAMTIPSTPPLVRLVVAGVANVALITVHVWPTIPDGRESIQNAVRYHVEDRVLWISHAILLLETTGRASDGTSLTGSLSIIVLAQALWQFVAWLDGLQSAPYRRYALVTTTAQLSHIISIYMTWRAQVLGLGHASIVVYLFFALSSALYEPRVSLPNFAADKSMSVWSKLIHPALNPVYTSVPLLAALYYTTQAIQGAFEGVSSASTVIFACHLCVSQMLLLGLRCLRHHHETKERQIVKPPTAQELWVDAAVLAVLKMLLISGLHAPIG